MLGHCSSNDSVRNVEKEKQPKGRQHFLHRLIHKMQIFALLHRTAEMLIFTCHSATKLNQTESFLQNEKV